MPVYPDIDKKTGKQRRKAGKLTWLVSVQVKGVPRYRRRHYGTRTGAIREEAKVYQSLLGQAGRLQNDKLLDPTFEEFAEWYIEYKRSRLKEIDTTTRRIRNVFRYIRQFGLQEKKLSEFTTQDILNFMAWRRKTVICTVHKRPPSEVTIKRDVVCWHAMLNFAVRNKDYFLNYNYVSPVELVKETIKVHEGITVEQFHQLVAAAPNHLKAVIMFAGYTGWRRSEITGLMLRRARISDAGGVAMIEDSKNREGRITTLSTILIDTIRKLPSWGTCKKCNLNLSHADEECQFVFTRAGKPLKDFKYGLKATYERAGLAHLYSEGKPFHRFRNFFRTNHADMGTDISVIMQEGGWKDPNMMMRYLNQRQQMRKKIAEKYQKYMEKGSARILNLDKKEPDARKQVSQK